MSTAPSPSVLIVGAGPTGLTLACELARRGVPFRLIESSPAPQVGSRGKGIQPRTLEVFDDLGVVDRVLANGRMGMPIRLVAADGAQSTTAPDTRPQSDVPYASSTITPEWRIEETLRLRLDDWGGAVEFGTTLSSFTPIDDGVSAVLVHDGRRETVDASWLIGCDGGHSVVRTGANIAFDGETLESVRMVVADLHVDGLHRDVWSMWRSMEGFVTLCPLPSTDVFQYQASIADGQDPTVSLENMQAVLERRSGHTDIHLRDPQWTSLWRANVRIVDRYRADHVLLAGDAAHIHSPAGGQGMNTGIQDAHNLGWKLAAVVRGEAPPTLLDTYEAERRPIALGVLALSNERLRQAYSGTGMPISGDGSTRQLGLNYRGSSLARDDRSDEVSLRAGDRAPDATALLTRDGERRLFDLTRGGGWSLLDFGDANQLELPNAVRRLHVVGHASAPDDVVDSGGHLAAAYAAGPRTLVLIRPDGYVGVISDAGDPTAVSEYLSALHRTQASVALT